MKKFEESEMFGVGLMQMQGPQIVDFFQKLMKNQNELIDSINALRLQVYGGIKIEAPNSSG